MKRDYVLLPTPPATAQTMCAAINEMLPDVMAGWPIIWGYCHGGRPDGWFQPVRCEAEVSTLRVWFDYGQCLTVENPICLEAGKNVFAINGADRVLFEWPGADDLLREEFVLQGDVVKASANHPWMEPDWEASRWSNKAVQLIR